MAKSVDDRGRGARMARRDEGAYYPYVTEEQRSQPGCLGREGDRLSHSRALSLPGKPTRGQSPASVSAQPPSEPVDLRAVTLDATQHVARVEDQRSFRDETRLIEITVIGHDHDQIVLGKRTAMVHGLEIDAFLFE